MHRSAKDLLNQKFGILTVKKYLNSNKHKKSIWLCQCDCGNEITAVGSQLISGHISSCGCLKSINYPKNNLVGLKIGKLYIKEFVGYELLIYKSRKSKVPKYLCVCDCGKNFITYQHRLITSNTKSCGCLKIIRAKQAAIAHQLKKGEAAINHYFRDYKNSANSRKLLFELSLDDFKSLIFQNCYYCGINPYRIFPTEKNVKNINGRITVNGIDRIDSKLGYFASNCVSCCEQCNKAKLTYTTTEFNDWINRINTYNKNKIIDFYCI